MQLCQSVISKNNFIVHFQKWVLNAMKHTYFSDNLTDNPGKNIQLEKLTVFFRSYYTNHIILI